MTYKVTILPEVKEFVQTLDEKSRRIIRKNLAKLEHPHPGKGIGDKERLPVEGKMIYRLHIGRTWTAFYIITAPLFEKSLAKTFDGIPH